MVTIASGDAGPLPSAAMAQRADVWKKYLDAGVAFTEMTRSRAEKVVRELVREGEVQRERAQDLAEELVARTRRNAEELRKLVRKEIRDQLAALGISTRPRGGRATTATTKAPAAKGTAAKKAGTAKKAPAKKAAAKKAGPASGA